MKKQKIKKGRIVQNIVLLLYVLFLVFPFLWVISVSFKPTAEIYCGIPYLLPQKPTLVHFYSLFSEQSIMLSLYNSFKVGVISTLLVIFISVPASYVLARRKTFINKAFTGWILLSQIFPVILIMVPLYIILRRLGLTDNHLGLSMVYVVWNLPFTLWMMQGFVKGIPVELEEAAAVDGATKTQMIYRVLMPLLLPAIGASALFAFISSWNEFFFALVLLKSQELITLPVDLARFTGMEGQTRTGILAAGSLLATIPSLIFFGLIQKWFSSGLMSGAVKE